MLGEITSDANGNLWFSREDRIDELIPSTGAVQEFPLPVGSATGMGITISAGPDGDLWFPFWNGQGAACLGQLDPKTGLINTVVLPAGTRFNSFIFQPFGADIAVGQDGKVWFTATSADPGAHDVIARFDPQTGIIQEFQPAGSQVQGITIGPDGKLWFTFVDSMGTIDPNTGEIKEFNLPAVLSNYPLMTVGADGNVWFVAVNFTNITDMLVEANPSTGVVKIVAPLANGAGGITATADGNLWFVCGHPTISEFNPSNGYFQSFEVGSNSVPPTNGKPGTGKNVSAFAGIYFESAVASFTAPAPLASPGQAYQATIDWGDGTTSRVVLTITASGTYDVVALHAYQTAGTYSIKVTIGTFDPANPLGDNPITVFSTANVDPFSLNMGP